MTMVRQWTMVHLLVVTDASNVRWMDQPYDRKDKPGDHG